MSGRITLWGAGELLRSFFSRTAEPPPSFWLAAIKDVAPTPYISGAELAEPDFAEYARVELPNDISTWSNDGQIQVMSCEIDATFAEALEDWGTIRYWAVCNAEAEGFVYFVGEFEDPVIINDGDSLVVNGGDLSVSLGPFFSEEG